MGGRRWTNDEIQTLEDMSGTYTVATIARRLGRSFDSVNLKMNRLGILGFGKSTDLLTMNQLCIMLGVEPRTVKKKWADKGLRIFRKGNYIVVRQEDLIRYLKQHPEDWNAANIPDDTLIMGYTWYKEKKHQDIPTSYYWKTSEKSRLQLLRKQGYSIREIAEKMGRSESSIKYKLYGERRS